jgi:hypothetical protein
MRKWFKCPHLKDNILIDDCLKECPCKDSNGIEYRCSSKTNLKECAMDRTWKGEPSVTQLISGTRESYLKIKYDFTTDIPKQVYKTIGSRGHTTLELQNKYIDSNTITEGQLFYQGISGKFDYLEETCEGKLILIDHKTASAWKVLKALGIVAVDVPTLTNGQKHYYQSGKKKGQLQTHKEYVYNPNAIDIDDWILQLNMYNIMLEDAGYPIYRMRIELFCKSTENELKRYGVNELKHMIDIPKRNDSEIIEYFNNKKTLLLIAVNSNELPMMCNEKENWSGVKCKRFCEVSDICRTFNDNKYLNDVQIGDSNFMHEDFTEDPF